MQMFVVSMAKLLDKNYIVFQLSNDRRLTTAVNFQVYRVLHG